MSQPAARHCPQLGHAPDLGVLGQPQPHLGMCPEIAEPIVGLRRAGAVVESKGGQESIIRSGTVKRLVALDEYARMGARDAPPVFVGRSEPIADIVWKADLVARRAAQSPLSPNPGLTRLVFGAPGAGKSALLNHLATAMPETDARAAFLRLGPKDLASPEALAHAIVSRLPKPMLESLGHSAAQVLLSIVPGVSDQASAILDGVRNLLKTSRKPRPPAPVVVMVDEAQTIAPHTPGARALFSLHTEQLDGLAVLPVFAGLGNLPLHLRQEGIGISRFADETDSHHALGALSKEETGELLRGWLEHFGVTAEQGSLSPWHEAIWHDTQGWPMHTNHFLTALAADLAARQEPPDISRAELEGVRLQAAGKRGAYYESRLADAPARPALVQLMGALREQGSIDRDHALFLLQSQIGGDKAEAVFNELVRLGFLQRSPGRLWGCPIPSMAGYTLLGGLSNPAAHKAALLGDLNGVQTALARDPSLTAAPDALGRTPLHVAAEGRWKGVCDALIDAGADPQAKDALGCTAHEVWAWDAPEASATS